MPQISKIRIVNFQYNDGKRLIADELFDFESENKGPSDILINLANGGGKSVLVQLMMQPIIPKAKVAGRRIESFFTKASDHCYVAIEWVLDESKMKLMTGIAMAASDSSSNSDLERGFQIKYYTFISSYRDYRDHYDIVSLPLSRKENGRFIPASFDEIRNLAKKSGGKLDRYSSDDSPKWAERLSQYGIIQNEWRMIEDLNSNEDGLSKYFSNLKTSDAVIDKLIIPRIENKENRYASRDDSSLETMLISYAKQFSKQQDTIKERDVCFGFHGMLEKTKTEAEELWKNNDSLEKCIGLLFAYSDALEAEIIAHKEKSEALSKEKSELNETIRHIKWEKVSLDYYACKETFEIETTSLNEAKEVLSTTEKKLDEAKKRLLLIECAYYYEQLRGLENQIAAINTEIANRESNSESSDKLASLKYSAYIAITTEIQRISPKIASLTTKKEDLKSSIQTIESRLDEIKRAIEIAREKKNKSEAIYDKQVKDDDEIAKEIGFSAVRMLDRKYQESDLDDWKQVLHGKEQSLLERISIANRDIQSIEERKDMLPNEISDAEFQLNSIKDEIERLSAEIKEYEKSKDSVSEVYSKHSLSMELLYTDHAESFLTNQISDAQATLTDIIKRIEMTEEAISAIHRGTLHISKITSDYLDGTGLRYISFEKYILRQQMEGLLSIDECQQILEKYPFAAYGIIIDEKDIETLYQDADGQWLPSLIPIFTASNINQIIRGEAAVFSSLSAYSKEYFLDSSGFEARTQNTLGEQFHRKAILEERIASLNADLEVVKSFLIYDVGWEQRTRSQKTKLENQSLEQQARVKELKQEQTELKERVNRIREEEKSLTVELNATRNSISEFEKLIFKLEMENKLYRDYEISMQEFRRVTNDLEKQNAEKNSLDEQFHDVTELLLELKTSDQALREGLAKVQDAPEAETILDEWSALLAQYSKLLEAQNADIKLLSDEKAMLQNSKDEKEKELLKRNCNQNEYKELIYSALLEAEATEDVNTIELSYKKADIEYNKRNRSQGKAETAFQNAQNKLTEFDGEALPLNEIGKAFDSRITEAEKRISDIDSDINVLDNKRSQLQKIQGKTESVVEQHIRPTKYANIVLEKDYSAQLNSLIGQISDWNRSIAARKQDIEDNLKKMALEFGSKSTDISLAIRSMQELLSNDDIKGDRYYTLCEHIDTNMHIAELRISQIDTDLEEFNKTKSDLIHQCVIQGKQIYEGLLQLSNNSKVRIQDGRRQMIKFDIPDSVDENIANTLIAAEIEKGASEIAVKTLEDSNAESEFRKIAARIVGSQRLLRQYINQENIVLKAYKIDRNPNNSGYRTWEQTQINNSGAEKFVVYFAVILALMTYTRNRQDDLGGKNNRSVLILDNPFGPISSKHVLEPMFEISRNYRVQMICLSDNSKSDVVSCFDNVIRAVVKSIAFGSKEQLTHDGNELIEHGFYRSEQMNLL